MRPVTTASIYQKFPNLFLIRSICGLVVLVAVYFISELTKFEFIITIFEHNYVHLRPNSQN